MGRPDGARHTVMDQGRTCPHTVSSVGVGGQQARRLRPITDSESWGKSEGPTGPRRSVQHPQDGQPRPAELQALGRVSDGQER